MTPPAGSIRFQTQRFCSIPRSLSLPSLPSGRGAESTVEIRHRFCLLDSTIYPGACEVIAIAILRNPQKKTYCHRRSRKVFQTDGHTDGQLTLNPAATTSISGAHRRRVGRGSGIRGCPCRIVLSQSSLVFDTKCINTQSFVNRGHHSVAQKLRSKASCRMHVGLRATESGSVTWTPAIHLSLCVTIFVISYPPADKKCDGKCHLEMIHTLI